jgi:hypothetical protein
MNIVVTLAEGDFLFGASVLYNSLITNGFDGIFIIGCRNEESFNPALCAALRKLSPQVQLFPVKTTLHFTNYKAAFMMHVLDLYPQCEAIAYLDPDIVINCPYSWMASWSARGPVACADVNWWMPSNHPTRLDWLEITGLKASHQLELYYNGGFVSIKRQDKGFLELWQAIVDEYGDRDNPLDAQGDIGLWRKGGRWLPFMTPDQDALNITLMVWSGPITTLGPDVMGFAGPALLPHAVGAPKPWRKHYLRDAFKAMPPRVVDKLYWNYADSPVKTVSKRLLVWRRLTIKVAAFVGRFYRRST